MELFPFIDRNFIPNNSYNGIICSARDQKAALALIKCHFNMHPLIPNDENGLFLTSNEIWKIFVKEIYQYESLIK